MSSYLMILYLQIVGKYYLRIDPLREGAKWRRSYGQEIYSPFLLAFTEQVKKDIEAFLLLSVVSP